MDKCFKDLAIGDFVYEVSTSGSFGKIKITSVNVKDAGIVDLKGEYEGIDTEWGINNINGYCSWIEYNNYFLFSDINDVKDELLGIIKRCANTINNCLISLDILK